MATVAIVPVNALTRAKGRLADHIDPATRRALVEWMLRRVLHACAQAQCVDATLVVAGDAAAGALAQSLLDDLDPGPPANQVLIEQHPGLSTALALADATTAGASATLVVAADLPLATAADLDGLWAVAPRGPCVVVAPTDDGGTGVLLRRPGGVIPTAYGPGSAAAHLQLGQAAGVATRQVQIAALAMDVDTPASLAQVLAAATGRGQLFSPQSAAYAVARLVSPIEEEHS